MSPQPATVRLDVISLTGPLWSGEVREVSLPGREGRFGVMARHLPLLSLLREGMLHLYPAQGEPEQIYVSGGYVEVQPDRVLVVADLAERNQDIDAARAQAARDRAASPMAENFTDENYAQLHLELLTATARTCATPPVARPPRLLLRCWPAGTADLRRSGGHAGPGVFGAADKTRRPRAGGDGGRGSVGGS